LKEQNTAVTKQDGSVRYWKTSGREERGGSKLKRKLCGKMEESEEFSSSDSLQIQVILVEIVEV